MNFMRTILFLSVIALIGTAMEASAANVEVFGGRGTNFISVGEEDISYSQERMNVVLPLMKRVDAYAGLEYTKSDTVVAGLYNNHYRYSFDYPDAGFGFRLKPVVGDRFQLYVALGAIAGEVFYRADFANSNYTLLSEGRSNKFFVVPRFGFGANVTVYRQWGLCAEASVTGPVPGFDVVVDNHALGAVENLTLNDGKPMLGVMLGVRHAF